jgi:malate synthase
MMISTREALRAEKVERAAQANDWHKERISLADYCFDHGLIDSTQYWKRLRNADIQWGKMIDAIYGEPQSA